MPQPHFESEHYRIPLAYLITLRSYGTWLHGDTLSGSGWCCVLDPLATANGSVVESALARAEWLLLAVSAEIHWQMVLYVEWLRLRWNQRSPVAAAR